MLRLPVLLQILALGLIFALTVSGREESYRIVVTFLTAKDNNITGVDLTGIKIVRQYGRRLVLDLGKPYDIKVQRLFFKEKFKAVQQVDQDFLIGIQQFDIGQIIIKDTLSVAPLDMTLNANNPDVDGVYIDSASQTPLWNLLDSEPYSIHVESVWKFTNSTPNVVVAVIDTGIAVQARNAFLNLMDGYDFVSDEWLSLDGDERDPDATDPGDGGEMCPLPSWHGTKVASVLAARHDNEWGLKGVAQNCSILPVRAIGMCKMGYATDVTDAIVWAVGGTIDNVETNPNPARIISLSLAGRGECPDYMQSAVDQAISLGAIVIAAAGNSNQDVSDFFPANCKGVIAVAATTREGRLAVYSNWGSKISISAPGGDASNAIMLLSVNSQELGLEASYGLGTSFATPHISGIMALYADLTTPLEALKKYSLILSTNSIQLNCSNIMCGGGILSLSKLANGLRVFSSQTKNTSLLMGIAGIWQWEGGVPVPVGYFCDNAVVYCSGCYRYECWNVAPCPAGKYQSATGEIFCSACGGGTFSTGAASICTDCPTGSYSPTTLMTSCISCPSGTFSAISKSLGCTACPIGTFSVTTGRSGCTQCFMGSYSDTPSSTGCINCASGLYSITTGASSASLCLNCLPGTYSVSGSTTCTTCTAGYYTLNQGSSICSQCTSGYYCPSVSTRIACNPGYYCPPGSTSQLQCVAGTYAPGGASTCLSCTLSENWSVNGAAACSPCVDKTCPNYQYKVSCTTSSDYDCRTCPPPPENAAPTDLKDPLCPWMCNTGYYRSGDACVICTTTSVGCSSGQYRQACPDGGTSDGQCVACTNKPVNSVYTGVSTTGITSNCPYKCSSCNVKDPTTGNCCRVCKNGFYASQCSKTSSGTCSACSN